MNDLFFQYERILGSWKDRLDINVLCIVDQDHQRTVIVVDPKAFSWQQTHDLGLQYQKWKNTYHQF